MPCKSCLWLSICSGIINIVKFDLVDFCPVIRRSAQHMFYIKFQTIQYKAPVFQSIRNIIAVREHIQAQIYRSGIHNRSRIIS